jgi:hypothetical protein
MERSITAAGESWLLRETARPLCRLRRHLTAALDSLDLDRKEGIEVGPDQVEDALLKAWEALDLELPRGSFANEKLECQGIMNWLRTGEEEGAKSPTPAAGDGTSPMRLGDPASQALWGFALLANKKMAKPRAEKKILRNNARLIAEKNLMGSLLLGTVRDKDTTIAWGASGSWFYHDPRADHINMDPGQALLLGLQNSRGILLHEIGHSQITEGRSPKIEELHKRIDALAPVKGKLRVLPPDPEKRKELARLLREASCRETLWQYAEDACVNTFAEIEGENFTNDIPVAIMRTYATILLGRETQAKMERDRKARRPGGRDPLAELMDLMEKERAKDPKQKEANEIEKALEERMKIAGMAYPVSKGLILGKEEEWAELGTSATPENLEVLDRLVPWKKEDTSLRLGQIQPNLLGRRFELMSPDILEKLVIECAQRRNQQIDDLFDSHFLPLLDKLPDPPELPSVSVEMEGEGEEKDGKEGEGSPKGNKKKEDDGKEKSGKGKGEEDEEGKQKGKPGGSGSEETNTVEDENDSLEKAGEKNQEEHERQAEEQRKEAQAHDEMTKQAMRRSMGQRSTFDMLPDKCGNYEEAAKALGPQIREAVSLLKKLALKQRTPQPGSLDLFPDALLGATSFDETSWTERKKKEAGGDPLDWDDRKHFRTQDNSKKTPATTHLAFYIDGSGSMSGEGAKKTMMTLIIFNEASKKVPEIQVSAVYSGADKTLMLLDGKKIKKEHEKLVADILESGYARGDNEISAGGLAEMNEMIAEVAPRGKAFGMVHTIFLSDGGSCGSQMKEIAEAVSIHLDGNPLTTFDSVILSGGSESNFERASKLVAPKRPRQAPGLRRCEAAGEICPAIVKALTQRIRDFKSFEPQRAEKLLKESRKTARSLHKLEDRIMG